MKRLLVGTIVAIVGALALSVAPVVATTFYCRNNDAGCSGTGACGGDYVLRTACKVDCYNTPGEGELVWVGDGGCLKLGDPEG
jgi:hypothetical protein